MTDDRFIDPSRSNFEAFKALPRNEPVAMLNLIQYRDKAAYPEGHPYAAEALTGEEAYRRYGEESGPVFRKVGGRILFSGAYQCMVIGPDDKAWDRVFIAHYPSASAFLAMVTDPDYQKAVVNRTAALVTSRLMRLSQDAVSGDGFA